MSPAHKLKNNFVGVFDMYIMVTLSRWTCWIIFEFYDFMTFEGKDFYLSFCAFTYTYKQLKCSILENIFTSLCSDSISWRTLPRSSRTSSFRLLLSWWDTLCKKETLLWGVRVWKWQSARALWGETLWGKHYEGKHLKRIWKNTGHSARLHDIKIYGYMHMIHTSSACRGYWGS